MRIVSAHMVAAYKCQLCTRQLGATGPAPSCPRLPSSPVQHQNLSKSARARTGPSSVTRKMLSIEWTTRVRSPDRPPPSPSLLRISHEPGAYSSSQSLEKSCSSSIRFSVWLALFLPLARFTHVFGSSLVTIIRSQPSSMCDA